MSVPYTKDASCRWSRNNSIQKNTPLCFAIHNLCVERIWGGWAVGAGVRIYSTHDRHNRHARRCTPFASNRPHFQAWQQIGFDCYNTTQTHQQWFVGFQPLSLLCNFLWYTRNIIIINLKHKKIFQDHQNNSGLWTFGKVQIYSEI